jgi:hypothetical protein
MGSNSPVAVESIGNSGQFKSAFLPADFVPAEPCSLQAVRAIADTISATTKKDGKKAA